MAKRTYQNEPYLEPVRQFLRNNQTTAEKILWQHLRKNQLGYKFRRQFSIGNNVADFYCHALRLVIEVDGWTHNFEKTKLKDVKKQKLFTEKGYKVIRYTNEQMFGDIELVLNDIKNNV